MKAYPDANWKVLVLWAPYLFSDSLRAAQTATGYLTDARVSHYWDLWRFGTKIYARQFRYPASEAWDLFVGYKPGITWDDPAPDPTFWFQHRDLDHGTPYDKEALEAVLVKYR